MRKASFSSYILLALAALVASCVSEPQPSSGTGSFEPAALAQIRLASPSFGNGENIPSKHTCDGENLSPELGWNGIPSGTHSIAIIADDPDATGGIFTHWVIYNIRPNAKGISEGLRSEPRVEQNGQHLKNDFGNFGWSGPCPPKGQIHEYSFILYALGSELNLEEDSSKEDLIAAVREAGTLGIGRLYGYYGR